METTQNAPTYGFLRAGNRQGWFDELDVDTEGLRAILGHSFPGVDIEDAAWR